MFRECSYCEIDKVSSKLITINVFHIHVKLYKLLPHNYTST